VIDSHTAGEPTRVVVAGGPDLGDGPLSERVRIFRERYDPFRSAIVNEPRGSDVLVGALLTQPTDSSCTAGVIFFNNVGYLGMCGHGTIGAIVTLAHLGHITPGEHRVETPVGVVTARLHTSGCVAVENVPSHRHAKDIQVMVPGLGIVTGDVAWGGNWFFLVSDPSPAISLENAAELTSIAQRIRQTLVANGVTGSAGVEIDHVELFAPSPTPGIHSRNFVLCPGGAYDRSPCGTGTSAKMACLFADGKLREGETWRQESVIGSVFEGTVRRTRNGVVIPTITGSAFVTADATLFLDPDDPFCWGIQA